MPESGYASPPRIESQLAIYQCDPLYRFTEDEARELADEVLRLRGGLRQLAQAIVDVLGVELKFGVDD